MTEGEGVRSQDRRGSVGFVIQQATKLYGTKDLVARITFDEFEQKVRFKYGIPLIVLHIVDYLLDTSFLKDHYRTVFPDKLFEKFDVQNEAFQDAKAQIDPDYLPYTWVLFNALGKVDFTQHAQMSQEEKETRQHITKESVR